MFTGIIEQIGRVIQNKNGTLAISVPSSFARGLKIGASVAVNGACLTNVKCQMSNVKSLLCFDVIPETLRCTNVGLLKKGDKVNLERALKADGRFEGHLVLGHIDATGRITNYGTEDRIFTIALSKECTRYIVPKGSIAVDGISLTVVDVARDYFTVAIIPHTLKNTIVQYYEKGTIVNVETDIIGKYATKTRRS